MSVDVIPSACLRKVQWIWVTAAVKNAGPLLFYLDNFWRDPRAAQRAGGRAGKGANRKVAAGFGAHRRDRQRIHNTPPSHRKTTEGPMKIGRELMDKHARVDGGYTQNRRQEVDAWLYRLDD